MFQDLPKKKIPSGVELLRWTLEKSQGTEVGLLVHYLLYVEFFFPLENENSTNFRKKNTTFQRN